MRPAIIWGKTHRDKLTPKELVEKLVLESSLMVEFQWDEKKELSQVHMEIFGSLAEIPSLKNSKIPGKNFTNPKVLAKLKALDILYAAALKELSLTYHPQFSDGVVVLTLRLPDCSRVDEDNAVASVKDWSEPKAKKVGKKVIRPRGWGIGLVENDRNIRGYPVFGKDIGQKLNHTIIRWRRFSEVKETVKGFFEEI